MYTGRSSEDGRARTRTGEVDDCGLDEVRGRSRIGGSPRGMQSLFLPLLFSLPPPLCSLSLRRGEVGPTALSRLGAYGVRAVLRCAPRRAPIPSGICFSQCYDALTLSLFPLPSLRRRDRRPLNPCPPSTRPSTNSSRASSRLNLTLAHDMRARSPRRPPTVSARKCPSRRHRRRRTRLRPRLLARPCLPRLARLRSSAVPRFRRSQPPMDRPSSPTRIPSSPLPLQPRPTPPHPPLPPDQASRPSHARPRPRSSRPRKKASSTR